VILVDPHAGPQPEQDVVVLVSSLAEHVVVVLDFAARGELEVGGQHRHAGQTTSKW
jgi:hypothetical protein